MIEIGCADRATSLEQSYSRHAPTVPHRPLQSSPGGGLHLLLLLAVHVKVLGEDGAQLVVQLGLLLDAPQVRVALGACLRCGGALLGLGLLVRVFSQG